MIETELLQELAAHVWLTTLNLDVVSSTRLEPHQSDDLFCAAVTIDGGWVGQIQVMCTRVAAAAAAAALFRSDVDQLTEADLCDAVGEVANVTGGAIKPLLPGECQLHPPVVANVDAWFEGDDIAFLLLGDQSIAVQVQQTS
jgi:chemotaxis protein CheX